MDLVTHSAGVQQSISRRSMKTAHKEVTNWKPDISDDRIFDRTLAHANCAFAHTQDVIKFVDAKCNILTVLTSAITGFALTLAKWNFELPKASAPSYIVVAHNYPIGAPIALVIFLISLVASAVCIGACLWSLIARPAPDGAFTVLFPVPRDSDPDQHVQLVGERLAGMSQEQIMNEFGEQLRSLGAIAQKKIQHSKVAALATMIQVGAISVAIIIYTALFASRL